MPTYLSPSEARDSLDQLIVEMKGDETMLALLQCGHPHPGALVEAAKVALETGRMPVVERLASICDGFRKDFWVRIIRENFLSQKPSQDTSERSMDPVPQETPSIG